MLHFTALLTWQTLALLSYIKKEEQKNNNKIKEGMRNVYKKKYMTLSNLIMTFPSY